ncbi:ABC transporter substrate-binding protein [Alkalihalobacillus sp. 1P02AB]|uniref:ABC transporter substrate-binding protein n=1 Tax=Alkalihalobacillus sp. 1P02AB TaxID=3132260 RepID=UPI0039A400B6
MQKCKSLSAFVVVLFLVISILTACSSSGGSATNEQGTVTLELAVWDQTFDPLLEQSIERLNEDYPHIQVNVTNTPWARYWDQIRTSIAGGSGPDVLWMNGPNFQKFAMNNLLSSLDSYVENDGMDTSQYDDSVIDMYTFNDEQYGIPHFLSVTVFFYNKRLFDEAGLDYPDDTWTWDDIRENAKKLTKETDNGKQYGFLANTEPQNGYYNFIYQAGGYIINEEGTESGFDLPETQQGLQFLYDMMYEEEVSPTMQQQAETVPNQFMGSGMVAMMPAIDVHTPALYEMLGDDLGIAQLPAGPAGKASVVHGLSFVMNSNTDHPDEAWALIKYLTDEESNLELGKSGLATPTYSGTEGALFESLPLDFQAIVDSMEFGAPYPISIETASWQTVEFDEMTNFFNRQQTVEEAGQKIADEMNRILADEQ